MLWFSADYILIKKNSLIFLLSSLVIKNKSCTFALPIGDNGIADGDTTSSEKTQSSVL